MTEQRYCSTEVDKIFGLSSIAPESEADDADLVECLGCGDLTGLAEFEAIDDEFSQSQPRCPGCQLALRIRRACCEFCGGPAEYEVELGFLCSEHHDHYVDGYREPS